MEGFAAAGIDLDCGVMGLGWDGAFWDGVVAFGRGETLGGIAVAGGGGAGCCEGGWGGRAAGGCDGTEEGHSAGWCGWMEIQGMLFVLSSPDRGSSNVRRAML